MSARVGQRVHAAWSKGRPNALVWTVRGVTEHGVYITCPESRSPGHLLSAVDFAQQYVDLSVQP